MGREGGKLGWDGREESMDRVRVAALICISIITAWRWGGVGWKWSDKGGECRGEISVRKIW